MRPIAAEISQHKTSLVGCSVFLRPTAAEIHSTQNFNRRDSLHCNRVTKAVHTPPERRHRHAADNILHIGVLSRAPRAICTSQTRERGVRSCEDAALPAVRILTLRYPSRLASVPTRVNSVISPNNSTGPSQHHSALS